MAPCARWLCAATGLALLVGGQGTPDALQPVRVFSNGDGGISCFRIPAAVRTAKGTLLAFAEGRHGSCSDGAVHEIVVRRSTSHGATWSNLTVAIGTAALPVGNPYPIALASGRVALVYMKHKHGLGPNKGIGSGIVWSDDDGLTWSAEQDVSKMFGVASGASPGPGAGVELASGRLLIISHKGAYVDDYITYSDDGGKTWTTLDQGFPKMDEATLADVGGGEVLLNMRHMEEPLKGRAVARSKDGGLTWSNITYDSALIGPICQGSLAAIGKSVYFSNPASKTSRSHLTVRRSDDGGVTWAASLLIAAGDSFGYSSLIPGTIGDDKHGGIFYEAPGGGLDFVLFPLSLAPQEPESIVV